MCMYMHVRCVVSRCIYVYIYVCACGYVGADLSLYGRFLVVRCGLAEELDETIEMH